jgi:hypothetical protein
VDVTRREAVRYVNGSLRDAVGEIDAIEGNKKAPTMQLFEPGYVQSPAARHPDATVICFPHEVFPGEQAGLTERPR